MAERMTCAGLISSAIWAKRRDDSLAPVRKEAFSAGCFVTELGGIIRLPNARVGRFEVAIAKLCSSLRSTEPRWALGRANGSFFARNLSHYRSAGGAA